jgi:hypothetical protein
MAGNKVASMLNTKKLLVLLCTLLAFLDTHAAEGTGELLVLMHDPGRVERYDLGTGRHLGTLISGLPPANSLLVDAEQRLLISTGLPGGPGSVLRFDPRGRGSVTTIIDIPEGYGGRLFRATGMAWNGKDLLVASQGDGKVKRYSYPQGEWLDDVALASPGGMTQIAIQNERLFITDFTAQALRRCAEKLDGTMSEVWVQHQSQAPWGLAFHRGSAFWSTSANRILRTDSKKTIEWAGAGGGLNTPVGLAIGPDDNLYAANLGGKVTVWGTHSPQPGLPLRVLEGPEVKTPISFAFVAQPLAQKEFVHTANEDASKASGDKLAFFESKIRPLLETKCIECHGEALQEGKLRLDSRQGWQKGGTSGSPIKPGHPESSLLIKAVRHADKDLHMPPDNPLPAKDIALLVEWVRQGAIDPRQEKGSATQPQTDDWAAEFQRRLDWWSLKPLARAEPPTSANSRWRHNIVDRFIKAGLEKRSLQPAPAADPETLLRRLSHVLTGLPPSPALRQRCLQESMSDPAKAYQALVEELINSPHFGERFARHWMDVVRYTDTYGYEWDIPAKGSFEYRDYLIRAFNQDIGFDTLLREQVAGDLVSPPRINQELGINESIIGPMFYHMGEHRHGSSLAFNGVHQEMVANKIDAFSKSFLATTVACAKCHNHKLEAISQRDYYALGAVFMTPRWVSRPADAPEKNAAAIKRLKEIREQVRAELAKQWAQTNLSPSAWIPAIEGAMKKPNLDDIDYPLISLAKPDGKTEATWGALVNEWASTRAARLKANEGFKTLADFQKPAMPDGWVIDGDGMAHGWVGEATPLVALEGKQVIKRLLPRGYHTNALSSKLPGALRMPAQHLVPGKFVSLEIAGGQFAGHLQMDENSFLHEGVGILNQEKPTWRAFADTPMKGGVTKVTVDLVTSSLNPNFPARVGIIPGLPNNDPGFDKRSWFSVTGVVTHDQPGSPQSTLEAFSTLFEGAAPKTQVEAQVRLSRWLNGAIQRWSDASLRPGDLDILSWLLEKKLLPNEAQPNSHLAALLAEYRHLESTIAFPRSVNSMDERALSKSGLHLNIRGDYDALGDLVPPDCLQMFAGRNSVAASQGSGRMELADSLLHPEHPLTARVYVNRVWQWIFGTGLVATPDDFGRLGDKPSHPDLLDWLARDFMEQGWSTKKLIRRMVLSETFRQSGLATEQSRRVDPDNRLRHHYPTRRMEAEEIRDAMLAVSGRLDPKLYGRPVNPFRPVEDPAKRLFSGPLDGDGRRSLYQTMSIMAPPKFLMTFDLPDLRLPSGKRNTTSVPTQALTMLNDPLVAKLAGDWGASLAKAPHATPAERIDQMFITAFGRPPDEGERSRWTSLLKEVSHSNEILKDQAAWTHLAHAIFNSQEFIHFR